MIFIDEKVRISGIVKHSLVDGPGIRCTVFFQGCPHNCPGCHNPDTHAPDGGIEMNVEDVIQTIGKAKFLDGVTLSGGDPFLQPIAVKKIADAAHQMGLNVWAYSGWTFESLISGALGDDSVDALRSVDVLVDGPFVLAKKSDTCIYRGSTNQRLIDVQNSFKTLKIIEIGG